MAWSRLSAIRRATCSVLSANTIDINCVVVNMPAEYNTIDKKCWFDGHCKTNMLLCDQPQLT